MPDVLKADDLDLSGDQRARTSHLPPQHGAPLPAVDPAATPDELRPHSVWLTELLHAFVEQRRLAREAAPAEPQGAGKGARLPAATDREGWEAAVWPAATRRPSARLRPTAENLAQLQPQHVATVLALLVSCAGARVWPAGVEGAAPAPAPEPEPGCGAAPPPLCFSRPCCCWLYGLLSHLDAVVAQQPSTASDLRLLFRLAVLERSRLPPAAPASRQAAAPINVLIGLLSGFFKVGDDLQGFV